LRRLSEPGHLPRPPLTSITTVAFDFDFDLAFDFDFDFGRWSVVVVPYLVFRGPRGVGDEVRNV